MDSYFLIKLLLSIIIGGAWVAATTIAAEKLGGKLGGLLGGLPSTVLVSYFFIAWVKGGQAAYDATTAFPLAYTIGAFVTFLYAVFPFNGFLSRLLIYCFLWLALQAILIAVDFQNYYFSLAVWLLFFLVLILYINNHLKVINTQVAGMVIQSSINIVWRVLISGLIIGGAILMTHVGGPLLGSIFAAFPGVFLSTIIISEKSVNYTFTRSLLLPMVLSGSLNCIVFIAIFRYLVSDWHYFIATSLALLMVVFSAYIVHTMIKFMSK